MKNQNVTTVTAIIPTRNRPIDLSKAVISILNQCRTPDELIIVDQSSGNESKNIVQKLLANNKAISLVYIHSTEISGLVEAKDVAAKQSTGEIVFFLEDDVVLEQEYIKQIELGFTLHPEMVGCCGIITNHPHRSISYGLIYDLFHVGIFRDNRAKYFGKFNGIGHDLIPNTMLSGGLSAWRREVFSVVPFDLESGFHMFEDIDFSTRVAKYYGHRLYINPNARLEHHCSPVNRDVQGLSQRKKVKEALIYYKKRKNWSGASFAMFLLLIGLLLESIAKSVTHRSLSLLSAYFSGIKDGISG
ncbi:glycosyltransferase family 2 protein [Chlorobium phaeovibrioides]|uniref:glycosyltransferase family 2 protein n=1 Tax=Chlorobium phaeovibrioides TaxID=1094 RepID=UPI000F825EBD|nr:glycosyltransferase family A protein [Chlorobium phaeovibrioides]RTY34208.1 glycosyltransferase family 2 protein [Chlorobium phaeovibrioides]